jgi:hypothetical protein
LCGVLRTCLGYGNVLKQELEQEGIVTATSATFVHATLKIYCSIEKVIIGAGAEKEKIVKSAITGMLQMKMQKHLFTSSYKSK